MNPYAGSNYASERIAGADPDLCCEQDGAGEGDCVKCDHCREEFEVDTENPKPCIERIAEALEALRAGGGK